MANDWLPTELSKLFNSPHISFPKPPTGIHVGPGPVDLFSTNFNNIFAPDVEATVEGQNVSRDELKQKLLNLQKSWKPEEVEFRDSSDLSTVAVLSPGKTVSFIAKTKYNGGRRVIENFGASSKDPSIFE